MGGLDPMSEWTTFFFTTATGFVAAGLTGSVYRLVTNKPASFQIWGGSMLEQIIGILTLVFAGPNVILRNALRAQVFENRPPAWLALSFFIAMMWSCLSGIFLLNLILVR
tara:strand:+ start:2253 stop:2582 length:330 start_codon:yes stop_codon:yes gene_type:complete